MSTLSCVKFSILAFQSESFMGLAFLASDSRKIGKNSSHFPFPVDSGRISRLWAKIAAANVASGLNEICTERGFRHFNQLLGFCLDVAHQLRDAID
jgi:hypothetical protein